MSETMSSSNPNDQWMQFYSNPNYSPQTSQPPPPPPPPEITGTSSPTAAPEGGRVARPARRRTRASRRTPTTLLNTDTSNFRAMVQQFTGGPAGPHAGYRQQSFSFGGGAAAQQINQTTPPYYQQVQQIQQQQQQQMSQQGFPYSFGGTVARPPETGGEALFQRLSSGRPAEEGFLMGVGHPVAARPRGWSSEQ